MVEPSIFGLYSTTWVPMLSNKVTANDIIEFSKNLRKLRHTLSCCVCKQLLLATEALTPSKCRRHFVCKGCVGRKRGADRKCERCLDWNTFGEDAALTTMIESYQDFCLFFLTTEQIVQVLEQIEDHFDACQLVDLVSEGLKGYPKEKKMKLLQKIAPTSSAEEKNLPKATSVSTVSASTDHVNASGAGSSDIPTKPSPTPLSTGIAPPTTWALPANKSSTTAAPDDLEQRPDPEKVLQCTTDSFSRLRTLSEAACGYMSFCSQQSIPTTGMKTVPRPLELTKTVKTETGQVVPPPPTPSTIFTTSAPATLQKMIKTEGCGCGKSGKVSTGKLICSTKRCACYANKNPCSSNCKCKGCKNPNVPGTGEKMVALAQQDVGASHGPPTSQSIPSITIIGQGQRCRAAAPTAYVTPTPLLRPSSSFRFETIQTGTGPSVSANRTTQPIQSTQTQVRFIAPSGQGGQQYLQILNPPPPPVLQNNPIIHRWPGGHLQISVALPTTAAIPSPTLSAVRNDHTYFTTTTNDATLMNTIKQEVEEEEEGK